MIYLIILYALLASTFSIGKILLQDISPILLVGIRMVFSGSLMLLYQYMRNKKELVIRRADWLPVAQITVFGIYLSFILEFWGMNFIPSFKTCTIFALAPFITYIIACLLYNEKTKLIKWVGMTIGFLGIMPILMSTSDAEAALSSLFVFSLADIAILFAAIFYCYGWFPMEDLVKKERYSPVVINGYSMLFGGIAALISAPYLETVFLTSYKNIALLLPLIILIGNIICYNLYSFLLRRFSPTVIAFASLLSPLFGAFYGWLFLSEAITWHFFASFGMVTIAFVIFFYDELAIKS